MTSAANVYINPNTQASPCLRRGDSREDREVPQRLGRRLHADSTSDSVPLLPAKAEDHIAWFGRNPDGTWTWSYCKSACALGVTLAGHIPPWSLDGFVDADLPESKAKVQHLDLERCGRSPSSLRTCGGLISWARRRPAKAKDDFTGRIRSVTYKYRSYV